MLEQLLIRNIALFEEARIQFSSGFHVLTGETGAGKSLVVDAVNFLCGARMDRGILRTGAEQAYVEGIFQVQDQQELLELLHQQDIHLEDGQLILSREYASSGRSVYRINGMAVSLAMYQEITGLLIDLHGQHEHQSLLHDSKHMRYLDLLGDSAHEKLLQETEIAFIAFDQTRKAYDDALKSSLSRVERMEVLSLRQKELQEARLVPGEEEGLQAEKTLLRNAEKITSALAEINQALFDAPTGDTAGSLLLAAQTQLEKILPYHPALEPYQARLSSLYYELEEFSHDLNTQLRGVVHDDQRLEEVEQRLDLLRKLQRKYGPTSEDMLQFLEQIEAELAELTNLDENLERLKGQLQENEAKYLKAAQALSSSRKQLASVFEKRIEQVLNQLNMQAARFHIEVTSNKKTFHAHGMDQVRMMIAPNVGEEMKPLSRIASGGELSRVMLAMKTLSAEKNVVATMVFDEIDTGVSGATAMVIAQKLADIGRYRQVICVTHLHQLAAMADYQYHVSKAEDAGRTQAAVHALDIKERTEEIAKMLGDIKTQGESSLQHARVLLQDARKYRERRA